MTNSYDLTQLDTNSFESMVNFLAMKVLGKGVSGFAPGADGGRDGYFQGEAPYPSEKTRWSGTWYIQSKFHKPHLSTNPQKWLIGQAREEIKAFLKPNARTLPDIWIIATNVEPSGNEHTGAYDKIQELVKKELGKTIKFDIWGGRKILDFLAADPSIASYYGHFLTPGNVLTALYEQINDASSQVKSIIEHLIIGQFNEQIHTKLEQANSSENTRPGIHELFVDLPYRVNSTDQVGDILSTLVSSAANVHKVSAWDAKRSGWREWAKEPKRARILLLKGGPGQGKSTAGQYFAQIQRAALILGVGGPNITAKVKNIAEQFKTVATEQGFWSETPRIPITIELKDFATWYGNKNEDTPRGVLSYITDKIRLKTEQDVKIGTMKRALSSRSWFINFDGLDEVPNDVKDHIAEEIIKFTEETLPLLDADVLTLCTTRPQGYSGQFDKLEAATAVLCDLPSTIALACASAVVRFDRSESEAAYAIDVLKSAMESKQVLELMTTPLQSHIMAVVVRDGGRPPEKRWELFDNFYKVMKKRESQKNFQDQRIAKLLREGDTLLKAIHTRLGIVLHALAEISTGAETTLRKSEFKILARRTTAMLIDDNVEEVVDALMEATIERLVFVNTPDSSSSVRFDIRQLQEFFAGEFIYLDTSQDTMRSRLEIICTDAHWREVMHFTLSALVANARPTELGIASTVLINADNSGNCHKSKLFNMRMAVGALLGLRLLQEGVLEQDKRLRHQFLNVLTPLYATLDSKIIDILSQVKHQNSNSWLINSMIDHLFQGSEAESIGAAAALVRCMPYEHPRLQDVIAKFKKFSNNFLEALYTLQLQNSISNRRQVFGEYKSAQTQTWFLSFSLNIITSQEHKKDFDYSLPLRLIDTNAFTLFSTSEFQKLTLQETSLLFALLEIGNPKSTRKKQGRNIYKGMTLEEHEHTWRNGKIPDFLNQKNIISTDNSLLSPVLNLLNSIGKFTKEKNHENFCEITRNAKPLGQSVKILPSSWNALVPRSNWGREGNLQFKELEDLTSSEFYKFLETGALNSRHIVPTPAGIHIEGQFSASGWKNVCRDFPNLALDIWMQDVGNNSEQFETEPFYTCIENLLASNPDIAGSYILHWARLFNLLPDNGNRLRSSLANQKVSTAKEIFPLYSIEPFVIDLPKEAHWLPIIAEILVSRRRYGPRLTDRFFYSGSESYDSDTLDAFGLSEPTLRNLYNDEAQDINTQRAALAIYLSQDFHDTETIREKFYQNNLDTLIVKLMNDSTPIWLVTSLFMFGEKHLNHNDSRSIVLIGHCFYIYRDNYKARMMMHLLLSNWRERSSAPVDNAQVLDTWLTQTL
jgi:hypothetical protein